MVFCASFQVDKYCLTLRGGLTEVSPDVAKKRLSWTVPSWSSTSNSDERMSICQQTSMNYSGVQSADG